MIKLYRERDPSLPGFDGPLPSSGKEIDAVLNQLITDPGFGFEDALHEHDALAIRLEEARTCATSELEEIVVNVAGRFLWDHMAGSNARYVKERKKRLKAIKAAYSGEIDRASLPEDWFSDPDFGLGPEPEGPGLQPVVTSTGLVHLDAFIGEQAYRLAVAYQQELDQRRKRDTGRQRLERIHRQLLQKRERAKVVSGFATFLSGDEELPQTCNSLCHKGCALQRGCGSACGAGSTSVTGAHKPSSSASRRRWEGASEKEKAEAMCQAISEGGRGIAITVNLTDEVVINAKTSKKGMAGHLLDRVAKLLKRRFGVPVDVVLVLEQGPEEKAHLHGVVDLKAAPRNKAEVLAVLNVLGSGSRVLPMKRQVNMKKLYDAPRWGAYPFKWPASTEYQLGEKRVLAATRGIRSAGRAVFMGSGREAGP